MDTVKIAVHYCPHYQGLPAPAYQSPGAAGLDLRAAIQDEVTIKPGEFVLIPTGIQISLPSGYEAQIRPRSGLALNHGITVLNSPGTIDADYRGEIKVILINFGKEKFIFTRGMRIAQMVVGRITRVEWDQNASFEETDRNSGGFGHTGV